MPLLDPIIEVMKPKTDPKFLEGQEVPENIQPILTLLKVRAQPYHNKADNTDYWEITTEDGLHYIRCAIEFLGDDEAEWTKLVGMLLDYAASKKGGD